MTTANVRPGCLGAVINAFFRREPPRWPAAGSQPPQSPWPDEKHPMSETAAEREVLSTDGPSKSELLPYGVRDNFLSPAEVSFYHVLRGVVGDQAVIQTKVGLGDIFYVSRPHENQTARQRISQKHVDFLLCEPKRLTPLVAIELDDSSHARPDRQERDEFVNRVFETAGLALLHFAVRYSYATDEVAQRLAPYLGDAPVDALDEAISVLSRSTEADAPLCPRCSVPMKLRTAKRGPNAGQPFYGCRNYPQCTARLPAA